MAKITTQITVVHYERCHNLGNYEHEKIRVEAIVGADDTPNDVIAQLRQIVLGDIQAADRALENHRLTSQSWSVFGRCEPGTILRDPFLHRDYSVVVKGIPTMTMTLMLVDSETESCQIDAVAAEQWQIITPDGKVDDDYDPMAELDDEPADDWPDGPPTE